MAEIKGGNAPSALYASMEPLFRPKGVAIIGASSTPFKQGNVSMQYLVKGGYSGGIFPVNRSAGIIEGYTAVESVSAIEGDVDCALFVIPAGAVLSALKECGTKGIKTVIIGANGFAELGTEEGAARQAELTRIAQEHGIRIVGPNTNGIWNATDNLSLGYNTSHGDEMTPGPVSIAAHSGALFNSIAPSLRRFGAGLSKFIPVGNEADLDMLDFLEFFIEDPATGVIGLICEALRDGDRLKRLAARAYAAGKPIVALKLGRSEAGAGAALAHSSRMAGNARAYDALFRQAGILQVPTIEAMAGVCALLSDAPPKLQPEKRGLICVTTSGGGGGLVADFASEYNIPLAGNADGSWAGTAADLIKTFDEHTGLVLNPIDGGNLHGWQKLEQLFEALETDGLNGPVLFFGHMLPRAQMDKAVQEILARRKGRTGSPIVCVAPGGLREDVEAAFSQERIPVFHDLATCFMAMRCLYDVMEFEPAGPAGTEALSVDAVQAIEDVLFKRGSNTIFSETESAEVLRQVGVSITPSLAVAHHAAAIKGAEKVKFPLVLKGLAPGVAHKNDAGLVAVGLHNVGELTSAYKAVTAAISNLPTAGGQTEIILQPMLSSKAELIIGVTHEPPLGHFLIAGLGGIHAEVLNEIVLIPIPASAVTIQRQLESCKIGALLLRIGRTGAAQKLIMSSLVDNLLALQTLVGHFGAQIKSVDVNPLLVQDDRCIGVDALVELR